MRPRPGQAGPHQQAAASVLAARTAVGVVFIANGLLFASLISRVPDIRAGLDLDNTSLGLVLLAIAAGSLIAMPNSGRLIQRYGAGRVVRGGLVVAGTGVLLAATGVALSSVGTTVVGLFLVGAGSGSWDVAMNVEAAEVERRLERTIMPRFHAGFSLGAVGGALAAVPVIALDVAMPAHLVGAVTVVAVLVLRAGGGFLPVTTDARASGGVAGAVTVSAWREPRTLVLGLLVLAFAVAEGSANDWLALALVDGHDASHAVGVGGFALFVGAMTVGRLGGSVVLDRWGRVPTLGASTALVALGLLVLVHAQAPALVALGILVWGLGTSLGFPVGMSVAADDPVRAAARVSVVSTIGYGAFLAGPPLLGALGDRVGTLQSLQAVALLMVPAAFAVLAARSGSVEERADVGGIDGA